MNIRHLFTILILSLCFINVTLSPSFADDFGDDVIDANPALEVEADYILDGEDDWESEEDVLVVNDPLREFNTAMFSFNDKVITYVFNPISKVYDAVIPRVAQKSINNIFLNIAAPKRFFNKLFQLKPKPAGIVAGRFLINSTIGLGGMFDPAKAAFKLEKQSEDFGQTLGHYGMGEGFYLVVPIMGPTTGRDILGYVGDAVFSPLTWFTYTDVDPEDAWTIAKYVRRVNNYSYNVRDNYERIVDDAFDPYTAIQHAYVQNRRKKIAD